VPSKYLICLRFARISYSWESDDLRHHIGGARNMPYDDAVAGTTLDLQAGRACFPGAELTELSNAVAGAA